MTRKRTKKAAADHLLDLSAIAPEKSEAYSPNLYRWLVSLERKGGDVSRQHVYRVRAGTRLSQMYGADTLFIGSSDPAYPADRDFFGARLIGVLCNGAKEGRYCFPGALGALDCLDGFWSEYLRSGRCAIDPEHHKHFSGPDRYVETRNQRTCKWCGAVQRLRIVKRVVRDEVWTLAEAV
jgi:hypothetical protein